jgi:hypothetical protein
VFKVGGDEDEQGDSVPVEEEYLKRNSGRRGGVDIKMRAQERQPRFTKSSLG